MPLRTEILASNAFEPHPLALAAPRIPRFHLARSLDEVPPFEERFERQERESLALDLETALRAYQPPVAVLDSVRALATPGSACVVTGQQPGLFGGPLYTLFKALHAVRLARSLAQAWERPVVPIFWNHADDHDVAEVHHAWFLNENFDLQRIALAGLSSGRQPVSRIRLSDEAHKLPATREAVRQTLAGWPHVDEALELFAPRDGETFATAFTRALTSVAGHLGLVVIEPDWIRERMSRALARLVQAPLRTALADGEAALRAARIEPVIEASTAALVYHHDRTGRSALRLGGDGFRYDGEEGSRTPEELAAEIVQSLDEWSPGALLRPLVQDTVLPVVAYVGGWGELGYLAQLGPLRERAGVPQTASVARWSATLVDPQTREAAQQLGVTLADVIASRAQSLAQSDEGDSPAVVREMRDIAERAAKELVARREALAQIDRGLAANLPRTADQIRSLVEKMCEKAERVEANRQGRGKRLVRRVANTLCPRGELQERVLGAVPFVARFGREWIDELFAALAPFDSGHLVAHLEEEGSA